MVRLLPLPGLPLLALVLLVMSVAGCGPSRTEVKKQKEQAEYHYKLAYNHYFDRAAPNADAARQAILKSLDLEPDNADARLLAGLIFMGREMYLRAIDEFQYALRLRPDFQYAMNNLGACYLALERWDDAIPIYEQLAGDLRYSTPGVAHNNLGWAWYKKGDLKKAETHFRQARLVQPQLCPAHNNLGMVYADMGKARSAVKHLQEALRRCPTYAEPHYHMGRLAQNARQLDDAVAFFKKCMELGGASPLADRCESRVLALTERPR
jgi:Tfp pilus assembly protein PilF